MGVKCAVIYYSSTGTNYRLAQEAARAAQEAGAEVRLRKVPELAPPEAIAQNPAWRAHVEATRDVPEADLADLEWADVYVFCMPTRYGLPPAQVKQFVDRTGPLWAQGKLANKVVTAMTSAANPHGGQEATLLGFYIQMAHWGCIIVPPGYTDQAVFQAGGNPYGTSVTAQDGRLDDRALAAVRHQVRRAVEVASWIQAGRSALAAR